MKLLVCAGGTGGGVYPALAVLDHLAAEYPMDVLWVGSSGGMEAALVKRAGIAFTDIPAAGVHGVGWRALPGNLRQLASGYRAAGKVLAKFRPDVLFFTGGYVAPPVALAGRRIPTVIFVPDIEPGMALKFLARFADRITVPAQASEAYFPRTKRVTVTGYPVRSDLDRWSAAEAYRFFDFSDKLPVLLVTGGSLGALSINRAVTAALPELLSEMQIIHLTGTRTWEQFKDAGAALSDELAARYRVFPYLHEMGAAFRIADLITSRAGASSLGEYPHFGIPAILVPYPHAWRYQKINADYLVSQGAAVLLPDDAMPEKLASLILNLMRDHTRRAEMRQAMQSLARPDAAAQIAGQIATLASASGK